MVWLSRLGIELHGGHLFAGVVQNGARCCKECINGQGRGFGAAICAGYAGRAGFAVHGQGG